MEPPDDELMQVLAEANEGQKSDALELLRQRYEQDMLACAMGILRGRVVNGLEGQDVVQEVFAELLFTTKAARFDPSRSLRPWLLAVVANKARDLLRSEQKRSRVPEPLLPESPVEPAEPAATREAEELLSQLSPEERSLCEKFYLEECSAAEIAKELGTEPHKVYRALHRIRGKLRGLRRP